MFYIYGKGQGMKTFMALSGDTFTRNKMKAEVFHTLERAEQVLNSLKSQNPDFEWELRGA